MTATPITELSSKLGELPGKHVSDRDPEPASTALSLSPRHVLYLVDTLNRAAGGAEATLLKLSRLLPSDRYRCSIATLAKPGAEIYGHVSCPIYSFPVPRTCSWHALKAGAQLRQLIRSQRVSILHTFFTKSDLWGSVVAKLSGCPIIASSRRDMGFQRTWREQIGYRVLNRVFDQVHTVSARVREFTICQDHVSPEKVITVHNGVDLDQIDSAPLLRGGHQSLGWGGASHVVVTVGNLRPVKGIDVLVRAAAVVLRQFPKAAFVLAGEPHGQDYMAELNALASSLGVARNMHFLGLRNDALSLLKESDVFCLPSRSEGLSNALLEAMACRLPCVATDVGGNGEVVIQGQTGFLVPSEQPEALAASMITLLRDQDLRARMGWHGREVVERSFSAQRMINQVVDLYDHLLQAKQSNNISQ